MNAADWKHVAYPKMGEDLEALGLDEPAMRATHRARFVAREKIHGANIALHCDGAQFRAARRKAWIEDAAEFFNSGSLLRSLEAPVRAVHTSLGLAKDARVIVYCELFGGRYPHPSVKPIAGVSAVQTGVWYAPHLAVAAFDIALVDGDAVTWLGADEVEQHCKRAGILTAPIVATGRLSDALGVALPFASKVHARFLLPAIEDNVAEGIVVSPRDRTKGGSPRVVLKRKIDRFAEDERFAGAEKSQPFSSLTALVNEHRVAAAWSKIGNVRAVKDPAFAELLRDTVVADVVESVCQDKPHLAHQMHDRSEAFVLVRAAATRAVEAFLWERFGFEK